MRKTIAAPVIACGLFAATMPVAQEASAFCDSADCVPNVARNVVVGTPCPPGRSYVFGLDSQHNTLICAAWGQWAPTGPLIGERDVAMPCDHEGATAQEPLSGNDLQTRVPGIPLHCAMRGTSMRWVHFDAPAP